MGAGDAYVCAGVESMSRVPMGGFNPLYNPDARRGLTRQSTSPWARRPRTSPTATASTRAEQEAFALRSQQKAAAASRGRPARATRSCRSAGVAADGCPRPDTTLEGLAALKPAFLRDGTVTAGTSSPLTDGAAAVLVTSEDYAARARPRSRWRAVRSIAVSGCEPDVMGIGPVAGHAARRWSAPASTSRDLDVVELNEAFASQAIACIRELGIDQASVNLDGGAIALGHPLGATGARITGKAAALLHREGGRYALATQCIGGGQGIATVLEAACEPRSARRR